MAVVALLLLWTSQLVFSAVSGHTEPHCDAAVSCLLLLPATTCGSSCSSSASGNSGSPAALSCGCSSQCSSRACRAAAGGGAEAGARVWYGSVVSVRGSRVVQALRKTVSPYLWRRGGVGGGGGGGGTGTAQQQEGVLVSVRQVKMTASCCYSSEGVERHAIMAALLMAAITATLNAAGTHTLNCHVYIRTCTAIRNRQGYT